MTAAPADVSLLVGLALLGLGAAAKPSCPLPNDILPCVCWNEASLGLVMDCSGAKDEPELAKIFAGNFPTTDFYELRIFHDPMSADLRLYSLEDTTLGEASFQRINITGTDILSINGHAFDKSRSTLQILALNGNRISEFPFGSLWRYSLLSTVLLAKNNINLVPQLVTQFLEVLDLSWNKDLVVEQKAFADTPSLQKINLSHTGQLSLQHGLFAELGHLQELDLSNNYLNVLEAAAIVTANASVTYLDFSSNEISFVRHDAIMGLAGNATLVMKKNHITLLTQVHWQHIFDQMEQPHGVINLAENPLVCGCDMAWIVLNEAYLSRFTDTTTCENGERVIFLDPNIFTIMC